MKKVTKFFMVALFAGVCSFGYAQKYREAPKANEKVIGTVRIDESKTARDEDYWYQQLLKKAEEKFPGKIVDIREMIGGNHGVVGYSVGYWSPVSGKVVYTPNPEEQTKESLSQALNKALRNVREGSRVAIDQVTVISSMDRGEFKDQLIDVLLDKGYKVVAKDYLEKLYEEQQKQQSGIYNDRTTVQENNFSAVGYFINVKVTETSLRVQVVNVSTGEYEGNATVNF